MTEPPKEQAITEPHKYWEGVWEAGVEKGTRFDTNGSAPFLVDLAASGALPTGRALVPGCGRGYDVATLATPERYVVGLEISSTGREQANEYLKSHPHSNSHSIEATDFFDYPEDNPFNLIYDTTFFCIFPPDGPKRRNWAKKMAALLAPGGELVMHVFPIGKKQPGGPPHAVSIDVIREILSEVGLKEISYKELEPTEVTAVDTDIGKRKQEDASGWGSACAVFIKVVECPK